MAGNQPTISRLERGSGLPSVTTLIKIASALGCDLVIALEPRDGQLRSSTAQPWAAKSSNGSTIMEPNEPPAKRLPALADAIDIVPGLYGSDAVLAQAGVTRKGRDAVAARGAEGE